MRRLVARYGQYVAIAHGDGTGVEEAFATACRGLGISAEAHPVSDEEWRRQGIGAVSIRNQWMIDLGVDLCLAVHRYLANSKGTKNCCRQAIEAGVPTYMIDSEESRCGLGVGMRGWNDGIGYFGD